MNLRFNSPLLGIATALAALSAVEPTHAQRIEGQAAKDLGRKMGLPLRIERPGGRVIELVRFVNGDPRYYKTLNWRAAQTISTDTARLSVSSLVLDGSNVSMGLWESNYPRVTHQEFAGRVIHAGDESLVYSDHACHVAGTMIASGVDSSAKGMAPNGGLVAWGWNNDGAEMSSLNYRISNHSYGYATGWEFGVTLPNAWTWYGNSLFGWYDDEVAEWDGIAYNRPGYLIFIAAGNDRNDTGPGAGAVHYHHNSGFTQFTDNHPSDGPYDCISSNACAKNVITVGAVEDINGGWYQSSDVVMSSFSSWGPTNDGRIKPDIVANGVDLYSTITGADNHYGLMSGTSMATPSASGSAAVLLNYWNQLHTDPGNPPATRSATLKGLIIHTAREAGSSEGPDYSFGWGLMDTLNAAIAIKCDRYLPDTIQELTLASGTQFVRSMPGIHAGDSVKVTICWTDPPHAAIPSGDTTTRALVNDLDLRVMHDGTATTYYPWTLNPANPSAVAVRNADNSRDNVEVVEFTAVHAGNYTVQVTHKGALQGGSQNFSLFVNGWYEDVGAIPTFVPDLQAILNDPQLAHHALMFQGTYAQNVTISQPMTIYSAGGTVTIGD